MPAPEPPSLPSVVDGVPGPGARLSAWLDRLGVRSSAQRDAAAAVVWCILCVAVLALVLEALAASGQISLRPGQGATIMVLGGAPCLLLAVRRSHPLLCLLVTSAFQVLLSAALPFHLTLLGVAPVVAAYTVGTLLALRPLAGVLALSVGMQVVGSIATAALGLRRAPLGFPTAIVFGFAASASSALLLLSAAAIGAVLALSREQRRLTGAWAAATVEHQALRTSAAIATERTRMARELHDIAAHHLSALTIQAAAAEFLVDSDPERAKQTIREVRTQGRQTLADMRSIVGILRDTQGAVPRTDGDAPMPGLGQLEVLFCTARAAGDRLTWRASGPTVSLSPLADVTAYRVVQEALANARQHAPGAPVAVTLTTTPACVVLQIENALKPDGLEAGGAVSDPPVAGAAASRTGPPGHGVLGMRERAALVGGQLSVGPAGDDAWRVVLELPVADDGLRPEAYAGPTRSGNER